MPRRFATTLLVILALCGAGSAAADKGARCTSAKLKAAGKRVQRDLACYAAAAAKRKPVQATCLAAAESAFTRAFDRAAKRTDCLGEAAVVDADVDTFVAGTLGSVGVASSLLVEISVVGEGTLEIDFTTPVASPSFAVDDVLVNLLRWDTGETSKLRVITYHGQESGEVTIEMVGPVVRGTLRQAPGNSVDVLVGGSFHTLRPGEPFELRAD